MKPNCQNTNRTGVGKLTPPKMLGLSGQDTGSSDPEMQWLTPAKFSFSNHGTWHLLLIDSAPAKLTPHLYSEIPSLDLASFQDERGVSQVLGTSHGFSGYGVKGLLYNLIEQTPDTGFPFRKIILRNYHLAAPQVRDAIDKVLKTGCFEQDGLPSLALGKRALVLQIPSAALSGLDPHKDDLSVLRGRAGAPIFSQAVLDLTRCVLDSGNYFESLAWVYWKIATHIGAGLEIANPELGIGIGQTALKNLIDGLWSSDRIDAETDVWAFVDQMLEHLDERLADGRILAPTAANARCLVVDENGIFSWAHEAPDIDAIISIPRRMAAMLDANAPSTLHFGSKDSVAAAFARVRENYVGQDEVVGTIEEKIVERLGDRLRTKPLVTALVVGGTGSGKTALPKEIANVLNVPIVELPCNECETLAEFAELLVGRDSTSAASIIESHQAVVLLLDEVDKAPSGFWKFVMTAFDTGILRADAGDVSLRHVIIICTSNSLTGDLVAATTDADVRAALVSRGAIAEHYVERFDIIAALRQLEGEKAFPLWARFLNQVRPGVEVTKAAMVWLEATHLAAGGTPGARARKRTLDGAITSNELEFAGGKCVPRNPIHPAKLQPRAARWLVDTELAIASLSEGYRGNDVQVAATARAIRKGALRAKGRGPVGAILLLGPTGAGKTFLCSEIARVYDKGDPVRVNCSQIKKEHEVSSTLFGAPKGYEGAKDGGALTRPLMVRGDRVVVFDEIDRGHASLMDVLMPVLDDGEAMDLGSQQTVDMTKALFVLTSNACQDEMAALASKGLSSDEMDSAARDILRAAGWKAEHLSRIGLIQPMQPAGAMVEAIFAESIGEFGLETEAFTDLERNSILEAARKVSGRGSRDIKRVIDDAVVRKLEQGIAATERYETAA